MVTAKNFAIKLLLMKIALPIPLIFSIIVPEAKATPFATVSELCNRYEGSIIGTRSGQQVRIACADIQRMWAGAPQFIPQPFFHEFRDTIRRRRTEDFSEIIRTELNSTMQCARDRLTLENRHNCQFPIGVRNQVSFILNSRNRIEKAEISIDRDFINPILQNMSARDGIINHTTEIKELLLHISVLHIRRISRTDELYSTDGRTLRVEIWPWRQP